MIAGTIALLGLVALHGQDEGVLKARGRAYVDSLCAPRYSGRGYVNNGDRLAAGYIQRQFERLGMKRVDQLVEGGVQGWLDEFTMDVNTFPDSCKVLIDGGTFTPGVDFLVNPASGSASGRFNIVHLTPDDLRAADRRAMTMGVVSGNAAMLHFPATENKDSLALYGEWERELMRIAPVIKRATGKLTWGVSAEALPFPSIEISRETWPDSAHVLELDVKNRLLRGHKAANVMAVAPTRTRSKEWVIIGAHYDHLGMMGPDAFFPGANDNASGVAMLLSLAEHFIENPARRNILFVAFAGEENGLKGSEWCAVQRPVDLGRVRLMINLDILGTGEEGIMVVNGVEVAAVYDALVAINTSNRMLPDVKKRGAACISDHCSFVKRGVPAVYIYTLGGIAAYHDVFDRPETLPLTEFHHIHQLLARFINMMR